MQRPLNAFARSGRIRTEPRWLLAALGWLGGTLGWLGISWARNWLDPHIQSGGWHSAVAWSTLVAVFFVLTRAVLDMLTDIRDWRYRKREDPLQDRLDVRDGRLGWGPSVLMFWATGESLIALFVAFALSVGGFSSGNDLTNPSQLGAISSGWWWSQFMGLISISFACFSLILRNSNAVFPVPYRWLGFARNCTEQEARELRWAWFRRGREE